jgi:putative transposase
MVHEEIIRYTYKLRPSKSARLALDTEWGLCRYVWNTCVATDRDKAEGEACTYNTMCKKNTGLRAELDWLRAGSSVAQQQTIRTWYKAKQAGFKVKGRGMPKFKCRYKALPSLQYTASNFSVEGNRLKLVKGVNIPIVLSRDLISTPSTATVYRDAVGVWWVSFVVRRDKEVFAKTDKSIGIDWGLKAVATTTDSAFNMPNNRNGRGNSALLKKLQQSMSKRYKRGVEPSNGYREAKLKVAKLHKKIANKRTDEARKWARKVVASHQYIAVEDFKPKFMFANRRLARSASDASIGRFKQVLEEYATRANRTLVLVEPAYTTMDCSNCLARAKQRLLLSQRTFSCLECGFEADRDDNAASVILDRAGFHPASDDGVRQ